jgi:hypothetical protein
VAKHPTAAASSARCTPTTPSVRRPIVDIGQLRAQLTRQQAEEAARRREREGKRWIEVVEAAFRDKGPLHREATLKRWRYLATREVPDVADARALWERDQWDPDAKAWRETLKTIEWETGQVARAAAAIEEWRQKHPVQALALRAGLKKPPADLRRLEQTHAESIRFLEGSQRRLAELERAWSTNRPAYERKLELEGKEIIQAKRFLGVIDGNNAHFRQLWRHEDWAFREQAQREDRRIRGRGRDPSGWSR